MTEKSIRVVVEAVGTVSWTAISPDADPRWNEPMAVARVVDADGHRSIVTPSMCFRNGTVINESLVGLPAVIEVYNFSPFSFNCPTMFGKRGV